MQKYKMIFESGVSEIIDIGSVEFNRYLGKIEIKNSEGDNIEEYYFDFDHVAAIIPQ